MVKIIVNDKIAYINARNDFHSGNYMIARETGTSLYLLDKDTNEVYTIPINDLHWYSLKDKLLIERKNYLRNLINKTSDKTSRKKIEEELGEIKIKLISHYIIDE